MMPVASTATLAMYLENTDFPVTKDELVMQASFLDAPDDVLVALNQLPDEEYQTMAALWDALGNLD